MFFTVYAVNDWESTEERMKEKKNLKLQITQKWQKYFEREMQLTLDN